MSQPQSVFISYRRDDSAGHTGRLYDHLSRLLTGVYIFMDVEGIPPGENWREVINTNVKGCKVLLVVIGKQWLFVRDQYGRRRLDQEDDPVRFEVEVGIKESSVRVIPVLVGGAGIPEHSGLPQSLVNMLEANAIAIDDTTFSQDAERLARRIQTLLEDRPETDSFVSVSSAIDLSKLSLPHGWVKIQLGDIANMQYGKSGDKHSPGEIPLYNSTGGYVNHYDFDQESLLISTLGRHVTYGLKPTVFRVFGTFAATHHMIVIQPDPAKVVLDYLWLVLTFANYHNSSRGSVMPRLERNTLRRMPIPLPPLEQQRNVYQTMDFVLQMVTAIRSNIQVQLEATAGLEYGLIKKILEGKPLP